MGLMFDIEVVAMAELTEALISWVRCPPPTGGVEPACLEPHRLRAGRSNLPLRKTTGKACPGAGEKTLLPFPDCGMPQRRRHGDLLRKLPLFADRVDSSKVSLGSLGSSGKGPAGSYGELCTC